jgi:hypothetical protein
LRQTARSNGDLVVEAHDVVVAVAFDCRHAARHQEFGPEALRLMQRATREIAARNAARKS